MITIKAHKFIQILQDEIKDRVQDCLDDSFIIFPFDDEFWCFYKKEKLYKLGELESLESAIEYICHDLLT